MIMQLSECLLRIYKYNIEEATVHTEAPDGDVVNTVTLSVKSFMRAMCLDVPVPLPGI